MMSVNPFHAGELEAQSRAGVGDVAQWAGGFIRDYLPEQHRLFHSALPFLIVAGRDENGKVWTTIIEGDDGFVQSPDPKHLTLDTKLDTTDPLFNSIANGADIGVLGIELATRRRNRFSGHIYANSSGFTINVSQSFGNCPQYIHQRNWTRGLHSSNPTSTQSSSLSDSQMNLIKTSDTMFIGSGQQSVSESYSQGFDASHRGGTAGFVKILDDEHVMIPDYAGNNFFNTIGNLMVDPRIGLLFIDFENGSLLQVSGRASIDWDAELADEPEALRSIVVKIDTVIERQHAVSLRWTALDQQAINLRLIRREKETEDITSFYFANDNNAALQAFTPGQHLPIELQIPGQAGTSKRTYSLSGNPKNKDHYQITIKRESHGLVSRHLHDNFEIGSIISAQKPSGTFVVPNHDCPLVLVSAGVGLTPMMSILKNAVGQTRPIKYIHGTRNGKSFAMRSQLESISAQSDYVDKYIYFSDPLPEDVKGQDYDIRGRISAKYLMDLGAGPQAHYMICGPASFISDIRLGLETLGIEADHIHFETFGAIA